MRSQLTDLADDDLGSIKRGLMCLLIDEHQGIWSLDELDRHVRSSEAARSVERPIAADTEDAIQQLCDAGLVHRLGAYVFATRTAVAAQQLNV